MFYQENPQTETPSVLEDTVTDIVSIKQDIQITPKIEEDEHYAG